MLDFSVDAVHLEAVDVAVAVVFVAVVVVEGKKVLPLLGLENPFATLALLIQKRRTLLKN